MKKYRVVVNDEVFRGVGLVIDYLDEQTRSPAAGERWWRSCYSAVESLSTLPHRCPKANVPGEYTGVIRVLIVGKGLFFYRVDDGAGKVEVLRFRHASQKPGPGEPEL